MAEAAAKSAALAAFSNQDMLSHNSCSWVQVEQGRPGGGGGRRRQEESNHGDDETDRGPGKDEKGAD
jgi:hypothetical protein